MSTSSSVSKLAGSIGASSMEPANLTPANTALVSNNNSQTEQEQQAAAQPADNSTLENTSSIAASRQPSGTQRILSALGYTFKKISPWIVPVLILLVWQIASQTGWLQSRVLPSPVNVAKAFYTLSASGELWTHVKVSAGRALLGLLVGGGLGLLLGLLNGSSRVASTLLDSTLQMVRNIPALALIPLVILWFGIDETAKLFLVSVGVFFPLYINTFHGIRSVDPQLIEMGKSYGLNRWQLYHDIILPGALPSILVGLRFSLGLVWVLLIVAETISAQSGIGYMTMNAREFLQTDIVLVGILLYALLGKLADVLAQLLERFWLRWHPGYQK
jgi:sulfonate transport system permease protein